VSLRAAATFLMETYGAGQRRACELVGVARSGFAIAVRNETTSCGVAWYGWLKRSRVMAIGGWRYSWSARA